MWLDPNPSEQRKGNVDWRIWSLVRANGMTISEKSEICTWHEPPALAQKGDSEPLWSYYIEQPLLDELMLDHC